MFSDPLQYSHLLWLGTVAASASICGIFTWYTRRLGMIDIPHDRHSHTQPTPRGGGAGIIVTIVLLSVLLPQHTPVMNSWVYCQLPGFVVLALMGWWDDRVSLSAKLRFFVQFVVSLYLIWCLSPGSQVIGPLALILAGLFLLWMINLYNFMDGSNGMAGVQGVFTGLTLAWLFSRAGDVEAALLSSLIAAACVGFLPWNLGKARVFMGDVASGSLGFAFAFLLIYAVVNGSYEIPVVWMVMLLFICDSTLTLFFRVLRGEQWYNPHRQHLYQRLIARGWSHGGVLLFYQLVNVVLVLPAIAVAVNLPEAAWVISSALTLVLGLSWLLAMKKLGVLG